MHLLTRCSFLLVLVLILASCGRKGPPTLKAYEKPEKPTGLTVVHKENKIILSWSYPGKLRSSIKGFQVLRSEGAGLERKAFVDSDQSSFVDEDFTLNVSYKYQIAAENLKDILSEGADNVAVIPRPSPPPPDDIRLAVRSDAVELSWKGPGEDVCYNIYKRIEEGKYSGVPLNREPVCATLFKDSSLIPEKTVYYTIRALHNTPLKDEGFLSGELTVKPSDFVPSPPSELVATRTDDRTYLVWTESPESWVKLYRVYRKTEGEEGFTLIGESKVPAFTDRQKGETKTWYMVRALGPTVESQPVTVEVQ